MKVIVKVLMACERIGAIEVPPVNFPRFDNELINLSSSKSPYNSRGYPGYNRYIFVVYQNRLAVNRSKDNRHNSNFCGYE